MKDIKSTKDWSHPGGGYIALGASELAGVELFWIFLFLSL